MRSTGQKAGGSAPPYYHGTSALAVVCITTDGFRLLPSSLRRWSQGALGSGIYVTMELETAANFAEWCLRDSEQTTHRYILEVRLAPGTRILRLDGEYDSRVIDYLRREFGKELLSPKFEHAIPANKHLTRTELIHLSNYLWERGEAGKRGGIGSWARREEHTMLRRYLMKHKYDGMGCLESDIGVVLFNPSSLLVDGMFQFTARSNVTRESLVQPDLQALANVAATDICSAVGSVSSLREPPDNTKVPMVSRAVNGIVQTVEPMSPDEVAEMQRGNFDRLQAYLHEVPRWQGCLRAFCKRYGLSMSEGPIASALEKVIDS